MSKMVIPFQKLDDNASVWIYQSSKVLNENQVREIRAELNDFLHQWTAHSVQLYTFGDVFYNRFVVVMVDESRVEASGCSLDRLTHFIQGLEMKYGAPFFDRMNVVYLDEKESYQTVHLNDLSAKMKDGLITEDTVVFDNLVKTKSSFEQNWKRPLKESWHKRFV